VVTSRVIQDGSHLLPPTGAWMDLTILDLRSHLRVADSRALAAVCMTQSIAYAESGPNSFAPQPISLSRDSLPDDRAAANAVLHAL
jgi:hypothetical protein